MAKIMASLPETKQGATEIEELLGDPVPLGGNTTELIRHDRRSWTPDDPQLADTEQPD